MSSGSDTFNSRGFLMKFEIAEETKNKAQSVQMIFNV